MTTCPICLNPAHSWECAHASLMARVRALSAERDAARKLATAKGADVDRLLEEQRRDLADVDRFRAMARRHQDERDEARAQLAALAAKADPRIGELTAKVRAGTGTAEDLRVLCDVAGRVALLEALVAERDELLAEAEATLLNERGETVPGDAVTEGWGWDGVSWAIDTEDGVIDVERIMAGWRIMGCVEDHAVYALARDAIKAANAARKG